jgi:hypothetical protein
MWHRSLAIFSKHPAFCLLGRLPKFRIKLNFESIHDPGGLYEESKGIRGGDGSGDRGHAVARTRCCTLVQATALLSTA